MYKTLFEESTLPVLIVNANGRVLSANKGFQRFCGCTAGELADIHLLDFCAPYERERFIFANLGKVSEAIELDVDLKLADGQSVTASIIFTPFKRRDQHHLLLIFRDVTTKRVKESQLRESDARYHQLMAERNDLEAQLKHSIKLACLGELAAGIAHEINNPLGIALGFSQDLLDEIEPAHPLRESIKIIEQETTRCVEVVQNLLELARPNPPQVTDVNLADLIEESVALLLPRIKNRKIQVVYDLDKSLPDLRLDPQLMQQALLNLLINAIQAMPLGGELSIGVGRCKEPRFAQPARAAWITIADSGQGISAENLDRIFEPFFSTKGSKGTGLGLAISQRIIENHNGQIDITSQEGWGTTCTICLPLR